MVNVVGTCAQQKEKRAKKKERKMAVATEGGGGIGCDEKGCGETPSEAVKESENTGKQETAAPTPKRSQKPLQYTKQSKTSPIPPPLRNRGKRRMHAWMWVVLTALVVFVLFLVGQQRLLY